MAKLQCYLSIMLILYSDILVKLEAYYPESDSTRLRFISTVFRHGDRTIDKQIRELYPNDPNINYDNYPNGNGELINNGKVRTYELGKLLRKKYDSFLGDIYYKPDVHARSTSFGRAKMSLQLVLAGLYPPARMQKWNPHLAWQPVDMEYTFALNDGLLAPTLCPKYNETLSQVQQTPEAMAEIEQFDDLMEELTQYTGKNITDTSDLFSLYHTLNTEHWLDLILPEWTQDIFPYGRLYDAVMLHYKLQSYNDELTRLNGGSLLYRMIQDMKSVINGTLERKINLFSAHDINIAAILYALDIFDYNFPEYASAVIVELHEKNGDYFVKVVRYLGIPPVLIEVQLPDCDVLCPFDKFVKLNSAITLTPEEEDPKCPIDLPEITLLKL